MQRRLAAGLALLLLLAGPVDARGVKKDAIIPGAPVEEQLDRHSSYVNAMGEGVHAPSARIGGGAPDGATAHCGDDTYSFSHSRSGTCSRHGGVGSWLR